MPQIDLKYGRGVIPFEYDAGQFEVLGSDERTPSLSDVEIGERLDNPIDSPRVEEIVNPGDTVLFVVPDATRQTGCGQVINLMVRRLIANGIAAHDVRIIFATGIHRKVTEDEKASILTPFIAQRIKTLDHDPRDIASIVRLGEISSGIPVELNRAVVEHDHVIIIGGVTFHYFAGFTGGRKLICPGLGSSRTVSATHKLAFDCEKMTRREGVDTGFLDGNAVHEAFMEIVSKAPPAFAVNTITEDGEITGIYCGDWRTSHRAACGAYSNDHTITITEKRDVVIASCGGYPYDINMIQAHKTLDAASRACREGGTIIMLSECRDGVGRQDFLEWFDAEDSDELAERLCEKYKVNGQTAWSLMQKAERFDIHVVTSLADDDLRRMNLSRLDPTPRSWENAIAGRSGYILPAGAKINVMQS